MADINEQNQAPQSVDQSAAVQAAVTQALNQEKKKSKKKKFIVFGIIAALIIVIIVAAAAGKDDEKNKVESISGSSSSEQAEAETQGEQKISPGNAVTTDKLKISYLSYDADYKDYDEIFTPESGFMVVRAHFKFENVADSDVSLSGFECYADDKKCEEFYGPDDYASPTLESISPGRSFDAVIYFEVPAKAENIEFEMEESLWSGNKLVFIGK